MVAIKDMEMPKGCLNCDFYEGINTYCDGDILIPYGFFDDCRENKRHPDCPLVEIEERKTENCTDCEEYNQEKYYCPKFCNVIRDTTKEMQEFYKGEHEKLERIEQIINEQVIMPEGAYPKLKKIKEVLDNG